mgnify:CR=1 FL=1
MHKTMHFCTLFDANYLDKGIVLYYSLRTVCEDFMLYFFALDQITYDILMDLNLEKTKVIELKAFENPELIKVKEKRSKGEYCWTCTPIIVKYVLDIKIVLEKVINLNISLLENFIMYLIKYIIPNRMLKLQSKPAH